jgi:ABC-type phosphate transport system substrate-binding protein
MRYVLVLLLALAACSDSMSPEESLIGRYALVTVNGSGLPYVELQQGSYKLELTAGHVQVNTDHTCSTSLTYRETEGTESATETFPFACTWTLTGNQVRLTYTAGGSDTGVVSGDDITIVSEGISFLFRK